MTKEKSNLWISLILAISLLVAVFMVCYVYFIIDQKNPSNSGNARNGSQKTISVIGTSEKIFVADIMEINANFVDNVKRDNFKKYIIVQGISKDQIIVYDKKLKVESDLVRKMEQIYNDAEQTKINLITYEQPKYYVRNVEDLKLSLLADGTKNALLKAGIIAENANSRLGQLIYSDTGAFKFLNVESAVEFNSASELDVFSRRKKAKILIEQVYSVYK